ncbi:hypothetical protein GIS00_04450 [Nakamurella sp. YIM 132087]|uniref:Thiamine biosynthesis protein ThiF n=1 Tax=Nakamurella alba TaxID=2665158 RepID=A0A7K1FGF5_9ACTN|nr:hypothetical protein [Nakamurella alba]MTD13197.1 hypothetical protein [Nakamurella alba]
MQATIDPGGRLMVLLGVRVVRRSADAVQIGTAHDGPGGPGPVILHQAPACSVDLLRDLDGTATVAEVLHRHGADPGVWSPLLTELVARGLVVPLAARGTGPTPAGGWSERTALEHRHGPAVARRTLLARADAVVRVVGGGDVAHHLAAALTTAGIGRVDTAAHPGPATRRVAVRPADPVEDAEAAVAAVLRDPQTVVDTSTDRSSAQRRPARPSAVSAAPVPVAADSRTDLVVLTGTAPAAPWTVMSLLSGGIAHLHLLTGVDGCTVGPLTLPGRSVCALCVLRHRSALDPGWPAVEAGMRETAALSPATVMQAAVLLALVEVLGHIDGLQAPATLDGTLDWTPEPARPRRRSWSRHPDCDCRRV